MVVEHQAESGGGKPHMFRKGSSNGGGGGGGGEAGWGGIWKTLFSVFLTSTRFTKGPSLSN